MELVEHNKSKIYYSIGEVAEMFDVNPSLIRFWESKFDILKPKKNKKGNRLFTVKDVDNLKLIHYFVKEKGMTLAGAQRQMKQNPEGVSRDMEIADRLLAIRAILLEIREGLKGVPDEVYHDDPLDDASPKVSRAVSQEPVAAEHGPVTEDDFAQPEADALLDTETDEAWVEQEILELDRLDSEIEELAQEAEITPAEADELIESPGELTPIETDASVMFPPDDDAFAGGGPGLGITEEELAMLDDGDTGYPPGDAPDEVAAVALDTDLFSAGGAEQPDGEPEQPGAPRIIEQTLF